MAQNKWKFKFIEMSREPNDENVQMQSDPKEISFYAESLSAWYQTNLECDKAKLTISSGAIGLLISLYCAFCKDAETKCIAIHMLIALLCFTATIITSIVIFYKNAKHIENIISENEAPSIGSFDVLSWVFFCLGIVFSLVVFCLIAFGKTPIACS